MKMRRRTVKITSLKDINELWSYLINSKVYRLSGRRCVSVWRWYCLDHTSLERFIEVKRLVITYDSLIAGVAIINKSHVSWKNLALKNRSSFSYIQETSSKFLSVVVLRYYTYAFLIMQVKFFIHVLIQSLFTIDNLLYNLLNIILLYKQLLDIKLSCI